MEGSEFINFKVLQSEVMAKHSVLQSRDNTQKNNDPLVSYSGFRLFFNGVHLMPNLLVGENLKFLGSIDQLKFDIEQQKIPGKLSYYLSFEKDLYAIWVELCLDKNVVGEIFSSAELLAYSEKTDIPKERFFNKDLDDVFTLDVLALHFKSIFESYTQEEFNELIVEGRTIKKGFVQYLGRNFQ